MKKGWIVLGVIVVLIIGLVSSIVGNYNRFVTLDQAIKASWAQVENQLQRRNDLIPNLVNTVKGYAKHESSVFANVAAARAQLAGAKTVNDKVKASNELDGALSRLLAIVENYPQLKANENFMRLQDELAGTENRIAVERMRYNAVVMEYNVIIKRFPGNIVAAFTGFKENEVYFKAEDAAKAVPKVSF
jgi:LemA protein